MKANAFSNGLSNYSEHTSFGKEDVETSKPRSTTGLNGSSTLAKVVTHTIKIQNGDSDTITDIDDDILEDADLM